MEKREAKTIIPPENVSELLFRMGGGKFFDSDSDIGDLVDQIDFTRGNEGKIEKREFCEAGGIIVQRGIVLVRGDCQALLSDRTAHDITKGYSILTSGGGSASPMEITEKKLHLPDDHKLTFDELGIGFSNPDPQRGNYMFMITRGKVAETLELSSKTKDTVRFEDADTIRSHIADKAMEIQILERALHAA